MAKKAKVSAFRGKVQQAAQKANNSDSNYGYLIIPKGMEMYVPTAGSTEKFDILPYTVTTSKHPDRDTEIGMAVEGEQWYKRPYRVHRDIGVDKDRYVCLTSFGKKCPICDYRAKRAKEGASKEELKAFNSSQRNLYAVVPRGIKKLEEEVHLLDFSDFNFQELINEEILENEQYEVFPDAEEGLTLSVRWAEESFMGNTFAKAGRIDFKPRKAPIDAELLEAVPSLDDCLKELSYGELEKIFFEMVDVDDDDEDDKETDDEEEEAPKKKSAKPAPVKDETPFKKSVKTPPAPAPKKKVKALSWEDLDDMDGAELGDVVEARELDIDVEDYDDEGDLRIAIAEALDIEIPFDDEEEEEEEEEEAPTPKKKAVAPPAKPATKTPTAKTPPAKATGKAQTCPHGFKFGKDCDKKSACDDCELWSACLDASEGQ